MKKRLFTGWKDVYSFTASQNMKSSGYKLTTILLGIVIAVIFALISILMAVFQDEDADDDKVEVTEDFAEEISEIFLVDNEALKDEKLKDFITLSLSLDGAIDEKLKVTLIDEKEKNTYINENERAVTVVAELEDKEVFLSSFTKEGSPLNEGTAEEYMDCVLTYINVSVYEEAGVSIKDLPYFRAPYSTQALSVNDTVKSIGEMLTEIIVPMIFSLLIYMLVIMHGQSVTKAVVAEKSSKLMEMILTSVKPYALITGKVLAVASMAIFQLFLWIACGFGGYKLGGVIAESINPEYINYVDLIIDIIAADSASVAFSIGAVVLSAVSIMVGFLMYCVLAGLVAAAVSKMEDISTAMTMFQIPVIVGWMAAYFSPMLENEILVKIVHIVPITSPFILPADVILGKCGMTEGVISFAVLCITTVILILITGKVYKGKIFNRR